MSCFDLCWLILTSCQFCFFLTMTFNKTKIFVLGYKHHHCPRLTHKKFEYGAWSYLESYLTQCKLFYLMLSTLNASIRTVYLLFFNDYIVKKYDIPTNFVRPHGRINCILHLLPAVTHFVFFMQTKDAVGDNWHRKPE